MQLFWLSCDTTMILTITGTPHGHSLAQSILPLAEVELKVLLADFDSFKNIDSILFFLKLVRVYF